MAKGLHRIVARFNIPRDRGFVYFISKEGHLCRMRKLTTLKEVLVSNAWPREKRDPHCIYYVDGDCDIREHRRNTHAMAGHAAEVAKYGKAAYTARMNAQDPLSEILGMPFDPAADNAPPPRFDAQGREE